MTARSIVSAAVTATLLFGGLVYLRDPPWLLTVSSGFHAWQTDASGNRHRWMSPHASFFVPSGAQTIEIPLRATFDAPNDWPMVATITVDDRPVDRIVLSDPGWRRSVFHMPAPSGRRVRRIDIRLDRTRDGVRGAQVGEIVAR
jgi:hypothetical protein